MKHAPTIRRAFLVAPICAVLAACATEGLSRSPVPPESKELGTLGFLDEPGITQDVVVARLGAPAASFEGGRIVSYTAYYNRGDRQMSLHSRPPSDCFALMIEYGAGRALARHSLIRHGAPQCRDRS